MAISGITKSPGVRVWAWLAARRPSFSAWLVSGWELFYAGASPKSTPTRVRTTADKCVAGALLHVLELTTPDLYAYPATFAEELVDTISRQFIQSARNEASRDHKAVSLFALPSQPQAVCGRWKTKQVQRIKIPVRMRIPIR